jgi:hypothetical protein
MVQALLDENEIPYEIMDDQIANILPHLAIALGGTRIMVNDDHYKPARIIIEEYFKNIVPESPGKKIKINGKYDFCPECNSKNIELTTRPLKILSVLLSLIGGAAFPVKNKYYMCNDCKSYWKIKKFSFKKLLISTCIVLVFGFFLFALSAINVF